MENTEKCPGINSEKAGKGSACEGCPNQQMCSSEKLTEQKERMQKNCQMINEFYKDKKVIVVMSGKGGVGKSTITGFLVSYISNVLNKKVCVIDADLTGPSMPRVLNKIEGDIQMTSFGISPVVVNSNVCVVSTRYMLPSDSSAVIWRGPKKNDLLAKFFLNLDLDSLDDDFADAVEYFVVDTPPGTSDEHLTLFNLFREFANLYVLFVTTSSLLSVKDLNKSIDFVKKFENVQKFKVMGIVNNMSVVECCPNCSEKIFLYDKNAKISENYAVYDLPYVIKMDNELNLTDYMVDLFKKMFF